MTVWLFVTQNDDADTDQHKREQRPDIGQVDHLIDAHHRSEAADNNAG